ncbi:hypothetical protein Noda2021_01850 [Candidatus Dependentiae bacterium Noda2021]|nr:hypothetical protein Noda2021_01850 [Candidatus Dependentiae bacterium Noda2021]
MTSSKRGIIPFKQVLAVSNNIGIAQVAMRLGSKLYDHYKRMGLGQKIGINLAGENPGFINPPSSWSKQSIISLSYGYEVRLSLLQLARVMGIIANQGFDCQPQLVHSAQKEMPKRQLYSTKTIDAIQEILELTTTQGTAKRAAIKGYTIICKTGTANLIENGRYNPSKNIYTCAGIIQKGNYQRVLVVFVKEAAQKNLYASTVAAPLFERIAEKLLIHDHVI